MKGYMGKLLFVDLNKKICRDEYIDEELYHDFMGGYGLGARILFEQMKPKVNAFSPENILGFVTGPLTGTSAVCSGRFAAVAKSPLTGTWGDANCGGDFGPKLKFAGYDAVFFFGIARQPLYLLIEEGKAELKDASDLWSKDCLENLQLDAVIGFRITIGQLIELLCQPLVNIAHHVFLL